MSSSASTQDQGVSDAQIQQERYATIATQRKLGDLAARRERGFHTGFDCADIDSDGQVYIEMDITIPLLNKDDMGAAMFDLDLDDILEYWRESTALIDGINRDVSAQTRSSQV